MSKAIKNALAALEKRFGEPVVMKMNDARIRQRRIYLALPLDIKMAGQIYTIYELKLLPCLSDL